MADPLSIAASIIGLLALSSKIIYALCSFTKSATEVPQSVSRVNAELQIVSSVFGQIQSLVDILINCVAILSSLERYINDWRADNALWERVKWVKRESEIEGLMEDLQRHKSSLNMMLSMILWCYSIKGYSLRASYSPSLIALLKSVAANSRPRQKAVRYLSSARQVSL
jgi:hypothetical protein